MSTSRKKKEFGIEDLERRLGPLTIAHFLRSWRMSEELSQADFARRIGLSPANLCDIEKGRKGVSIEKACEIAKVIGYSPTVLVKLVLQEQVASAGLNYDVELKKRIA